MGEEEIPKASDKRENLLIFLLKVFKNCISPSFSSVENVDTFEHEDKKKGRMVDHLLLHINNCFGKSRQH